MGLFLGYDPNGNSIWETGKNTGNYFNLTDASIDGTQLPSCLKNIAKVFAGLIDANTGQQLTPLSEDVATRIAKYHYAENGAVSRVLLIEKDPPTELQARALPVWRVDFDDVWNSTFYIDPNSGQFTTRRHSLWRVFDFLWMLHVMDYDERADINNNVLRIFSVFGTLLGLSGAWLLFYSFNRRRYGGPAQ